MLWILTLRFNKSQVLLLLAFGIYFIWGNSSNTLYGQSYTFCDNPSVSQIAWSPDGEQLAVSTQQGIHFFDRNLELIRTIQAPVLDNHRPNFPLAWSPDSAWNVLPQPPIEFLEYGGGSNAWSVINVHTGEIDGIDPLAGTGYGADPRLVDLAWSSDNRYIALLQYVDPLGLESPFSELVVRSGISETQIRIRRQRFQDIQLTDLQWTEDNIITVRVDGLVLSFDIETLQPNAAEPYFYPSWWVPSLDGSRETAYYETIFYVRELGQDQQEVLVSPYLLSDGSVFTIGQPSDIHWMLDNQHIIAIYNRNFPYVNDPPPDLPRILQGTVVDAVVANEINHFLIIADSDITDYSVSSVGDRIAIFGASTRIELWNPLTNELVASVDAPSIEIEGYCD